MTDHFSPDQPSPDQPGPGQPGPGRFSDEISNEPQMPRRSRLVAWATLGAVGVAAAVGGVVAVHSGGGGGTANAALAQAAAVTSPAPSPSASPHDRGGRRELNGPGGPGAGPKVLGGPGASGMFGARGKVLHGEATVVTPGGGTEIVDTQSGTITAIDSAAKTITVTSTDKAAFSYVIDTKTRVVDFTANSPMTATLTDLKVGDTVRVVATRSGDTRTATSVLDGVPIRVNRPMGSAGPTTKPWGWSGQQGQQGKRGPTPSAAASASTASA